MNLFLEKVAKYFEVVNIYDDYCEEITTLRKQLLEEEKTTPNTFMYNEEKHYPLLVVLKHR